LFFKKITLGLMLFCLLTIQQQASGHILSGSINKEHVVSGTGVVIDGLTVKPLGNAVVSVPSKNIFTRTNANGEFQLHLSGSEPVIMSVKKDGYCPFSLVVSSEDLSQPLKIVLLENSVNQLVIDSELRHLGDNNYSERSANAMDFSAYADGPYFIQEFYLENVDMTGEILLKIGSIIGIDTRIAQSLRQSGVRSSSSSPVKVYVNSQKVGEITFNGDNHAFSVPACLLKPNRYNIIKIETGVNLDAEDSIDYDDIEFMNVFLDTRSL